MTPVWKGIAQDALIMNLDDLLCVGAVDNILVSSTIGRNKNKVPGELYLQLFRARKNFRRIKILWVKYLFNWRRNSRCRRFGKNYYRRLYCCSKNEKK